MPNRLWLQEAIKWAQTRVKDQPPLGRALTVLKGSADHPKKARASLVLAAQDCQSPQLLHEAAWKFANACSTFASESRERASTEDEKQWLSLAYPLYEELAHQSSRFAPSRDFASTRLRELGVHSPKSFDPLQLNVHFHPSSAMPSPKPSPHAAPKETPTHGPSEATGEAVETLLPHEPSTEDPFTEQSQDSRFGLSPREDGSFVSDADQEAPTSSDSMLVALAKEWQGGESVAVYFVDLAGLMAEELKRSPTVRTNVTPLLDSDRDELRDLFANCGLPSDAHEVQQRAMAARAIANRSINLP